MKRVFSLVLVVWLASALASASTLTSKQLAEQDAQSGAIHKMSTLQSTATSCKFISKSAAVADALKAVGGGTVIQAVLESTDNPPDWSVDVLAKNGKEYEVKVNACNGSILAIILGG